MNTKSLSLSICAVLAFIPRLLAGESLLWKQELSEPAGLYASPALEYFVVSYRGGEGSVSVSSGIKVYDRDWKIIWSDPDAVLEDISWYAGVIAIRIPAAQLAAGMPPLGTDMPAAVGFSEESEGSWRIVDIQTGATLREAGNYLEAVPILNMLPLFREPLAVREGISRLTGPGWRVSGISDDGEYLSAYNSAQGKYECGIFRKIPARAEAWEKAGPCGGGMLVNGGYLLNGENDIPTDPAEMEALVSSRTISVKIALKGVGGKEGWNRRISFKHGLDHHVLLDYPIAWFSGGKVVAYIGPALQLFDMQGNAGPQIPYAADIAAAKKFETRTAAVTAPRLALTMTGEYYKFYCWDEEEAGKFRRQMRLYKGKLSQ